MARDTSEHSYRNNEDEEAEGTEARRKTPWSSSRNWRNTR